MVVVVVLVVVVVVAPGRVFVVVVTVVVVVLALVVVDVVVADKGSKSKLACIATCNTRIKKNETILKLKLFSNKNYFKNRIIKSRAVLMP